MSTYTPSSLLENPSLVGYPPGNGQDFSNSLNPPAGFPTDIMQTNLHPPNLSHIMRCRQCFIRMDNCNVQQDQHNSNLAKTFIEERRRQLREQGIQPDSAFFKSLAINSEQFEAEIEASFRQREQAISENISQVTQYLRALEEEENKRQAAIAEAARQQAELEARPHRRIQDSQPVQNVQPSPDKPVAPTATSESQPAPGTTTNAHPTEPQDTVAIPSIETIIENASMSPHSESKFRASYEIIHHIKEHVDPVVQATPEWWAQVSEIRRTIRVRVGQLVNTRECITRVADELDAMINRYKGLGQAMYMFVLNKVAKGVTQQIASEVSVHNNAAYPLAHLCVLLFQTHPKFLDVLLARLIKRCPYVTPAYPNQCPNETRHHYLRRIGYRRRGEDGLDDEAMYTEKMIGYMVFYAAIVQTQALVGTNVYGLERAWVWFSRLLNLQPQQISATLIQSFLEAAGTRFIQAYPRQGGKLLRTLMNYYFDHLPTTNRPALMRLKGYLEDYVNTNVLKELGNRDLNQD
ncbi:hypothetical protein IWQ62_000394 [Dispira parvispora]|uniref:mRNA export factor GLE1 n=1 Tax=Dispira parvispora TaxID=1520584 RepID=A0A9W8E9P6_9FUNG|nr:hypothetical protein IWQ62_000394 [Dispira parvispora]